MKLTPARQLTLSAILAAVYAVCTLALPVPPFGAIQIRVAEALTLLPFLIPGTVPGLVAGCLIANLFSPFPLDILFGTGATLLACLITARVPRRWMAPLPPVVCNALIVGFEIAWSEVGLTPAFWPAFWMNVLTVGFGELVACAVLGLPLLSVLGRIPAFRALVPPQRQHRLG